MKENISFTERKGLSNHEKSIASLWMEVRGRNRNTLIYLLGCDKESTHRYKDILHYFSLQQHTTKPTRKSKTLLIIYVLI